MPQRYLTRNGEFIVRIDLLDRARLELLNKRGLRYNLQDAEKDYFLAVALNLLYSSKLKNDLVFKGGTAIYHCYVEQLRFSNDLDFTSKTKLSLSDLEGLFSESDIFTIKEAREKKYGLDISLRYTGPLGQPDTIEVDINTNQKVLLEPCVMEYRNHYNVQLSCLVMDKKEIFAEKIRTLNERARPRDPYDLVILRKIFNIEIKDGLDLLKRKESHAEPDKDRVAENLALSLGRFDDEMKELYYRNIVDKDEIKRFSEELIRTMG